MSKKIIGIDLGTTNCCVAVMEGGKPVVIPNREGGLTTPSVVGFSDDGTCLVGAPAKRRAILNPDKTVYSIKRFIGEGYDNIGKEIASSPFNVVRGNNNIPCVEISDRRHTPQEISAILLMNAKLSAEEFLGTEVDEAIITVPAYFSDSQRQATKEAGVIAGLKVRRIISEPTAAAIAYGVASRKGFCSSFDSNPIAVFHMGGGTFDISILDIGDGVFDVKSTNGNTHLGGDDFDRKIVDWMAEEFLNEHGTDLRKDPTSLQRLNEAAEKAKKELSESIVTEINLPFISMKNGIPLNLTMKLTRIKFEQLCQDLINAVEEPCRQALRDAGLTNNDLQEIIVVGGASRIPAIQQKIRAIFGKTPHKGINPDEAVAIGAAIQGGILTGEVKNLLLLDVTPHSLGIETAGGVMTRLIDANTSIPTKKSQVFSTSVDNQTEVQISILQGERPMAADNRIIGHLRLPNIPPSPRGVPQIEVTFDIDANGIFNVSALDKKTGKSQNVRLEASSGLNERELTRMIQDGKTLYSLMK